ncbi:Uncharacterised protein [Chlamydia abortus]|nr:Uncharacterised protein [Chlamydia abortus]
MGSFHVNKDVCNQFGSIKFAHEKAARGTPTAMDKEAKTTVTLYTHFLLALEDEDPEREPTLDFILRYERRELLSFETYR